MSEFVVKGICTDSRQVKPGDLFMAVPGITVDGRNYIHEAIQKGASAVLVESLDYPIPQVYIQNEESNVPIIPISNLKGLVGNIASRYFDEPSKQIPVIGITGTSGKTSTTCILAQILSTCGELCGMIGTLGVGFFDKYQALQGTTPDPVTLQHALRDLILQGAKIVTMEVTSHALDQNRVSGVQFHSAILTNLERDHLDYHQDLKQYAAAKQKLFTEHKPKISILNLDDPFGVQLAQLLRKQNQPVIGYTTNSHHELYNIVDSIIITKNLAIDFKGISAIIETPWGQGEVRSSLLGKFNYSNLLAAIAATCHQGISLQSVLKAVHGVKSINGRMMCFGGVNGLPLVVVDYAHKPDALDKVLSTVRSYCQGKLWCVFGCGGERDQGKRPMMAGIAERLSDYICLTQDNPRRENPKQIMNEMITGLHDPLKAVIEYNRKDAIWNTILAANPEDCIVIAGKGHEDYQIIGIHKKHFSDCEEVENALKERQVR